MSQDRTHITFALSACKPWLLPFELRLLRVAVLAFCAQCAAAGRHISAVEIVLTDDAEISALNRQFMGCQGPTNVLSFPGYGSELSTLAVSLDCLAREARVFGLPLGAHLLRLIAHGVAHLAGFEHGRDMDEMCSRELSSLESFGEFAPYLEILLDQTFSDPSL